MTARARTDAPRKPATLRTARLSLRGAQERDRAAIAEALGDYEVAKWTANVQHLFGPADVKITDATGAASWPVYAGIDLDGTLVGMIRRGPRTGYWLHRAHWRQGYMTEALSAVFDADFAEGDHDAVLAGVFEDNLASRALLTKLGFTRADTPPEPVMCRAQGRALTSLDYILTRAAWEGRK